MFLRTLEQEKISQLEIIEDQHSWRREGKGRKKKTNPHNRIGKVLLAGSYRSLEGIFNSLDFILNASF